MDEQDQERLTDFFAIATGQITEKPCRLVSLEVAGTAAAPNTAALYDGFSTGDTKKLHILALQNSTVVMSWPQGTALLITHTC